MVGGESKAWICSIERRTAEVGLLALGGEAEAWIRVAFWSRLMGANPPVPVPHPSSLQLEACAVRCGRCGGWATLPALLAGAGVCPNRPCGPALEAFPPPLQQLEPGVRHCGVGGVVIPVHLTACGCDPLCNSSWFVGTPMGRPRG